jgi:hypothetical protein
LAAAVHRRSSSSGIDFHRQSRSVTGRSGHLAETASGAGHDKLVEHVTGPPLMLQGGEGQQALATALLTRDRPLASFLDRTPSKRPFGRAIDGSGRIGRPRSEHFKI